MICRHCHTKPVNRPRGLCWGCYGTPGVRELYPKSGTAAEADVRVALWPVCPACGLPRAIATGHDTGAACATCQRPEDERQGYRERIALYAARADDSRPLFSGDSNDSVT